MSPGNPYHIMLLSDCQGYSSPPPSPSQLMTDALSCWLNSHYLHTHQGLTGLYMPALHSHLSELAPNIQVVKLSIINIDTRYMNDYFYYILSNIKTISIIKFPVFNVIFDELLQRSLSLHQQYVSLKKISLT